MKERKISKWIKPRKNSKGRLLCLIPDCKRLRSKSKNGRMRNYCKGHTFYDIYKFNSWRGVREEALKRDNYTCVKCGDDRKIIKVKKIITEDYIGFYFGKNIKKGTVVFEPIPNLIGDHIKPIAIGGDEFDLKNIQILCLKCNKIKTKQDAHDIARQRRIERVLVDGQTKIKK